MAVVWNRLHPRVRTHRARTCQVLHFSCREVEIHPRRRSWEQTNHAVRGVAKSVVPELSDPGIACGQVSAYRVLCIHPRNLVGESISAGGLGERNGESDLES